MKTEGSVAADCHPPGVALSTQNRTRGRARFHSAGTGEAGSHLPLATERPLRSLPKKACLWAETGEVDCHPPRAHHLVEMVAADFRPQPEQGCLLAC